MKLKTLLLLLLLPFSVLGNGFPGEWDPLAVENLQKSDPFKCDYAYVVEIDDPAFLKAHAHPKEEYVAIVAIGVVGCGKGHSPAGVVLTNGVLAYNVSKLRNGIFERTKSHEGVDALVKAKKVGFTQEFRNPNAHKAFNYYQEMFHRGGVSFWRVTKFYAPFWEQLKNSGTLEVSLLFQSTL